MSEIWRNDEGAEAIDHEQIVMAQRASTQTISKLARQRQHIADYYKERESAEQNKTAPAVQTEAESDQTIKGRN